MKYLHDKRILECYYHCQSLSRVTVDANLLEQFLRGGLLAQLLCINNDRQETLSYKNCTREPARLARQEASKCGVISSNATNIVRSSISVELTKVVKTQTYIVAMTGQWSP
jgi:hypothetical protein